MKGRNKMARNTDKKIAAPDRFSEQKRTLADAKKILKRYHKCLVVRPTGFGKTWLLTELIRSYKNVLYLYPSAVVADTVVDRYYDLELEDMKAEDAYIDPETIETVSALRDSNNIKNCDLMTYAMLIRQTDRQLASLSKRYDLIICDEAHRLGGAKTKIAMERIMAKAPLSTDFIGATATPTRMDNFDVASHFYSDHMTYIYTLHDAIEAKLLQKPVYCYATYDFKRDVEDAMRAKGESLKSQETQEAITSKLIEISELYNMPRIIKEVCDAHAKATDYMKFIVFFASRKHLKDKLGDVVGWFEQAYPKHSVATLEISSADKISQANTDKLSTLVPKKRHIDLIACIDMLNMGYHVSNQTGIMMYRGTKSGTIFVQQLGRALSAGAEGSAIVFDIVDNLHRKAVYDLSVKDPKRKPKSRSGRKSVPQRDDYILDEATGRVVIESPDGNIAPTQYRLNKRTGEIVDRHGNPSTFVYDPERNAIINTSDPDSPAKNVNAITPDCLIATGHEAKYREIIAKAMAEPMIQRCKYALELHFRSWCLANKIKYPLDKEQAEKLRSLDIAEFYKQFKRIVRANKIAYPLGDIRKLMAKDDNPGPTDIPLSVCCEAKGVSIEQLTDVILGISEPKPAAPDPGKIPNKNINVGRKPGRKGATA